MSIYELLNKMELAEQAFLDTEFLAPVLPDGRVRVRIAGIVCTLRVIGRRDPGWAILRPLDMERARVVIEPSLAQIRDYLALFPALRLLLVARQDPSARSRRGWLALPAHRGDSRFQIEGPVPVHLVRGAEPFQRVVARYDGSQFWFQEIDRRRSPAIAAYLQQALVDWTPPEDLYKPTLTAEEREVYRLVYQASYEAIEAARRDRIQLQLADALAHAGARLLSYIERQEAYTVVYTVDGQTHRSTVGKDDLTVLAAGICLSGQDRRFDLQSLVGVLRAGARGWR
jgi:hypothetical protein